jgi:hypothetical protein
MKNKVSKPSVDDLRPEYDFDYSKAVRGKYYRRLLEEGSNVIVLDPEIAKAFRDSAAVNEALRSLLEIAQSTKRLTSRSTGSPKKRASR